MPCMSIAVSTVRSDLNNWFLSALNIRLWPVRDVARRRYASSSRRLRPPSGLEQPINLTVHQLVAEAFDGESGRSWREMHTCEGRKKER